MILFRVQERRRTLGRRAETDDFTIRKTIKAAVFRRFLFFLIIFDNFKNYLLTDAKISGKLKSSRRGKGSRKRKVKENEN